MTDTIFALATARGKAGIAVVRVSGPAALEAAAALGVHGLVPRQVALRRLMVGEDLLDDGLVLFFEEGASFTGEKIVEFQIHGSEAVVAALLAFLAGVPDLRLAEPGEFTRRALENGRLDLTQVEALADLIDAETEAQRRQAQRVLAGGLGQRAALWRKDLIRAGALIEATIDFADEDIPVDVIPEVCDIVERLSRAFADEIDGSRSAERVRAGFEVAITGAPNVGKSSLLNALVGRDVAITSAVAGTTRDIIEVRMDLGGLPVTLLDTAGLREATDEVERIGVERARERARLADLRVLLLEPGDTAPDDSADIIVWSKADIAPGPRSVSGHTGYGLDGLIEDIRTRLQGRVSGSGLLIRDRHRSALALASESMASARKALYAVDPSLELVAADIRSAGHALDLLVGKIGVETLLDEIFSSFCIGK
ncbi:MAG: tRNA uridine-5-carboxymethylaminomethyl(34) synthesis GTPase MnmE [Pseudotabrizicola sp.]|uniref:tRNA uridine-5-carboxymethylaminomethyl(34) synthesis GTPase MnmE n=1 Tax=Pseudotabrizicola sp. TaxID=2939647 RepID=UPI0027159738|nr:tRNA uridine-5-carboxymethylaminomethyl(34) synthesis GTPase MnmE [Pseudotabrizicola sp.]MDO9639211.1 tRNA uridine-5-carboxymethylaminomethyl(34) synthesis GTPase MnmE [Pseudotabrizicola sp.]